MSRVERIGELNHGSSNFLLNQKFTKIGYNYKEVIIYLDIIERSLEYFSEVFIF